MPVGHTGGDSQGEEMQVWSASHHGPPDLLKFQSAIFSLRLTLNIGE